MAGCVPAASVLPSVRLSVHAPNRSHTCNNKMNKKQRNKEASAACWALRRWRPVQVFLLSSLKRFQASAGQGGAGAQQGAPHSAAARSARHPQPALSARTRRRTRPSRNRLTGPGGGEGPPGGWTYRRTGGCCTAPLRCGGPGRCRRRWPETGWCRSACAGSDRRRIPLSTQTRATSRTRRRSLWEETRR